MKGIRRTIAFLAIAAFLVSVPAMAQVLTSRVEGTIRDQQQGVMPGVEVTLSNQETNVERSAISNDSGLYVFPQVPAGLYRVTASIAGFRRGVVEDVRVEVGVPATVDMVLEVGVEDQVITVRASEGQSVLNTVNAEINTVVNRAQIEDLPLPGRNVTELALQQAGVTGRGEIAREAAVNGNRGTFNNLTLDGVNNQDNFIRTDAFFGVIPLRESFIEEFNITTSNNEPDAGLGVAQTQLVTRSGTNAYHGELFYYHQNDALDANTFFNNKNGVEKQRVLNHQYGGNFAGPILKNKLFFFADLEREENPATVSVVRPVFSGAARDGNFTYARQDNGQQQTVNLFDLTGFSADPIMRDLFALTPLPNDSSTGDGSNVSGFRFNSPAAVDQDWLALRVDYEVNDRNSVSGTFHQFRFDLPNDPFNGLDAVFPGLPGAGQSSVRRLGSYSWRSNLTARLTNEARFGFQWAPVDFFTNETFSPGYQLSFADGALGETPLVANPIQNVLPQGRNSPVYDLMDNAAWVKGNHTFKFGGGYRRTDVDSSNDAGILPTYVLNFGTGNPDPLTASLFPGGIAGSELSTASEMLQLLGGFVDKSTQSFNVTSVDSGFVDGATNARLIRQNFFSLYGSDTWRLHPRLTLTYGLRWEFHGVPNEVNGLALLPVGGAESVLDPDAVVDFAGGSGRPFFNKDWNNFSPSLALAWSPWANRKTVFRAGYTINYVVDNNISAVTNVLSGNDGLRQTVNISGLAGTVSSGGTAPVPTPAFQVPRTARDQILADPQAALFTIDPEFKVPYVQQWNIGIQHEIMPDTVLEVRYLGNHGLGLSRAVDLNQVRFPTEFVDDFQRAQRNLAANGDPAAGEALTVFPQLGLGGFLQSAAVRQWIANGEIGQYVGGFLAPNRAFFFAGEGGEAFGATLPVSFFYANPNIFVADVLGNHAFSKYNALQIEVRRRFRDGLTAQFNYTYGKALTDFSGSQSNFRGLFNNAQPGLEIMRPDFDITHTFNGNFIWRIPVGNGRRFMNGRRVLDKVIGGWDLSGLVRVRSGEVVNIVSGRGTINRGGSRATTNTVDLTGLTIPELQDRTGVYEDANGRILLFDPSLIGPNGTANPSFFSNPGLLEAGSLGLAPVSGPWYATLDLGFRKSFGLPVTEESRLQFRFDFFNILNRTNFNIHTQPSTDTLDALGVFNRQNINNTSFGLIDSTFGARSMQVGLKFIF